MIAPIIGIFVIIGILILCFVAGIAGRSVPRSSASDQSPAPWLPGDGSSDSHHSSHGSHHSDHGGGGGFDGGGHSGH